MPKKKETEKKTTETKSAKHTKEIASLAHQIRLYERKAYDAEAKLWEIQSEKEKAQLIFGLDPDTTYTDLAVHVSQLKRELANREGEYETPKWLESLNAAEKRAIKAEEKLEQVIKYCRCVVKEEIRIREGVREKAKEKYQGIYDAGIAALQGLLVRMP